MTEPGMPL